MGKFVGIVLALGLGIWLFAGIPMSFNHRHCGSIFLCEWERDFAYKEYEFGEVGVKAFPSGDEIIVVTCFGRVDAETSRCWDRRFKPSPGQGQSDD